MSMPAERRFTYDEYLALERETNRRHEFLDGQVTAMSGGSLRHSGIKVNLGASLVALRGGPCRPYDSDAKVRVVETGFASYADFAVVCGPIVRHPEDAEAMTNPTALFEVLSPGTEAWDRGTKFQHAQRIPSLRLYVLVAQGEPLVEVYERIDDAWRYTAIAAGSVPLRPLGIALPVDDLYADLPTE